MDWFLVALRKYAVFEGRAQRSEYWFYVLFILIIALVLGFISGVIGTMFLVYVFDLAILVPSIAVATRRLHDTGRSGWWQLIYFIPLIGAIVMIVFLTWTNTRGLEYGKIIQNPLIGTCSVGVQISSLNPLSQ